MNIRKIADVEEALETQKHAPLVWKREGVVIPQEVHHVKPKQNNQNQKRFSEIIIMQYDKKAFGKVKLTVGVLKGSRKNIQYCITAIEKTANNPPRPGNS
jgi:hypothetical protein